MKNLNYFMVVDLEACSIQDFNVKFQTKFQMRDVLTVETSKICNQSTDYVTKDLLSVKLRTGQEIFSVNFTQIENFLDTYIDWLETCGRLQEEGIINDVLKLDIKRDLEDELKKSIKEINEKTVSSVVAATTETLRVIRESFDIQHKSVLEALDKTLQTAVQLNANHSKIVDEIHKDLSENVLPQLKDVSKVSKELADFGEGLITLLGGKK